MEANVCPKKLTRAGLEKAVIPAVGRTALLRFLLRVEILKLNFKQHTNKGICCVFRLIVSFLFCYRSVFLNVQHTLYLCI